MRIVLFFVLIIFCSIVSVAQSIKIDYDKKVISIDSLNLSSATSAQTAINMLPEMLNRPGTSYASSYTITINGMSVGDAHDAALSQLHISDIARIEVSESPISSYQNNGQGGTINIVLRTGGNSTRKNFWGSASLDGSVPMDILPQLYLGRKSDKFMIQGIMLGEWSKSSKDIISNRYVDDVHNTSINETDKTKFFDQLARVYMKYSLTDKDCINFNISENTSRKDYDISSLTTSYPSGLETEGLTNNEKKSTTFQSLLTYSHSFNPYSSLSATVQYDYSFAHTDLDIYDVRTYGDKSNTHNISGNVAYALNLLPASIHNTRYSDLSVGINLNKTICTEDMTLKDFATINLHDISLKPTSHAGHFMPYICSTSKFGRLKTKLSLEYQDYHYNMKRLEEPYSAISHNFTGKFIAEWKFNTHRHLRFILDRKLRRPTDEQVYPILMFSLERGDYVKGNVDLRPIMSHEASLDYISTYRWGSNTLMFDIEASYNHVNDIICTVRNSQSREQELGYQLEVTSFINKGTNDIISGNFMAIYSNKKATVSLSANIFNNSQVVNNETNHYTNFILSLMPSVNLTHGFTSTFGISYFSKVTKKYETLGDYSGITFDINKTWNISWGAFSAYIFGNFAITNKAQDTLFQPSQGTSTSSVYTSTLYKLQHDRIGAGVMLAF